ncbi:MAG TPA: RHS repeat-associated core domain-containing protein [Actinomycetota bacterium]
MGQLPPTTYAHTASGAPMAEKTGSVVSFHLRDPHGDVVRLASAGGANQGTVAYDAYGKPLAASGSASLLGYQGDITDPITKNVDMGTRWYGPGSGRFSSRDVIFGAPTSPMSLNQFGYGAMNPVTMADPTGMYPTCDGKCSGNVQKRLIQNFSQTYGAAVQAGTAGSTYYSPAPPPPPPAPPITHLREGGDYVEMNSCTRLCTGFGGPGQDGTGSIDWGLEEEGGEDDDPGCGFMGWRCYDDAVGAVAGGVAGCVQYLLKCADDVKRIGVLPMLATGIPAGIALTVAGCATALGCVAAGPTGIAMSGAAAFATYKYGESLYDDRQNLFNFSDCTADAFFCGDDH